MAYIRVWVMDGDTQENLSGVEVTVETQSGSRVGQGTTNSLGRYSLTVSSAGTYLVYLNKQGYNVENFQGVSQYTDNMYVSYYLSPIIEPGYVNVTRYDRQYTGSSQVVATCTGSSGYYYLGFGSSSTTAPSSWTHGDLSKTAAGTYYIWAKCDAATGYYAKSASYVGTVNITSKPAGSIGTAITPSAQTYSGGSYTFSVESSGATNTVGIGAIISITKNGSSVSSSGWSYSSANHTVTTTSGIDAGTYSVTLGVGVAETESYSGAAGTCTWNLTVNKAFQSITVTPTGNQTLYDRSGYNSVTFTVSGNVGTVGYNITSGSSYITASASGNTVTVTYKASSGSSSATILIIAAQTTNYNAASKNYSIITKVDTITSTQLQSTTYGTPSSVTIGSGLTAAGGSATCSCTCTDTKYYKDYYASGYVSAQYSTTTGSVTWSIASQTCAGGGSRFSISGSTLSHTTMGANTTYDKVTVRATNSSDSTKYTNSSETSISNTLGTTKYKNTSGTEGYYSQTYGTPSSVTIGSGLTAAGGSATCSCTCTDTFKYYLRYTSGTYTSLQTDTPNSSITWSIYSQTCAGGTNRFSISGSTLSHSSMGTNTTYDKVTVKATNSGDSSKYATSSEKSISNGIERAVYQSTTYGTPSSVTIGSGLSAAGGSATCSCTCKDTDYYKDLYTSGSYGSQYSSQSNSSITWSIYSQTCAGGTNRFSISGSTLSHSSMGTNTTYDKVIVKATNTYSTSKYATSSEKSISNGLESISLSAASGSISYNGTTTCSVTATYTSGSTSDVTSGSTYSTSPTGIVTIS